jgi:5-methylthioadenosine/S-adenosylhomocysteine deaminase
MRSAASRLRAGLAVLVTLAALGTAGLRASGQGQPAARRVSLIVTNATVVTQDREHRVLERGAVAIDGATIAAVGTAGEVAARFTAADTIDASGMVVLPGLINTHTHAPMVMYRGLADDLALMDWLQQYIFPAEAKTVSPEMVRIATRLAALEMIQSGTTTFADMYYFEEEVGRAARAAGLRGVLGETIIGFPVADARTPADALRRTEAFIKEFQGDDLITPVPAPHSMYTLDEASLVASRQLADRYGVPLLIHLAETEDEVGISRERHKLTPVAYLESIGVLGPKVVAAHGVWVDEADTAILKRRGVKISHNPESNMKLASGTAPVTRYLKEGLTVSLGTDGAASNNDLDMFEAMRQAAFLHKLATRDPQAVPAATALEMATMGGARALGLESKVGSLEAGKHADLIVVSMKGARQTPMYNAVSHLVYVTRGDDVQTTVVDGRVLMRDRRVLSLDERAVLADARALAQKVREAVRTQGGRTQEVGSRR